MGNNKVVISAITATRVYFLFRLQIEDYTHTAVSIGVFLCIAKNRIMMFLSICRSQWCSGSTFAGRSGVVAAHLPTALEVSGTNRAADKRLVFYTKITAIRSFGHGLHIYCSA